MRRFVLAWKHLRLERRLGSRIITYADDLVICCRRGNAEEALQQMREIMSKLKLTVNEEKTRICRVPQETFDFLGYTFGRLYSRKTGKAYTGMRPSKKSISRLIEKLHVMTVEAMVWQETAVLVQQLNRVLRGWDNYFQVGTVSMVYRLVEKYTRARFIRWLRNKHKVRRKRDFYDTHLFGTLGLVQLTRLKH